MAEWALVENGSIAALHDNLPKNWRNVSGLNLSAHNTEFLKSLGWYRVTKSLQEYNQATHKIIVRLHTFTDDKVVEELVLQEIEPSPPAQDSGEELNIATRAHVVNLVKKLENVVKVATSYGQPIDNIIPRLPNESDSSYRLRQIRIYRNQLLRNCDWTQLTDVKINMGAEQSQNWKTYRQTLRDITSNYENGSVPLLSDVVWPIKPSISNIDERLFSFDEDGEPILSNELVVPDPIMWEDVFTRRENETDQEFETRVRAFINGA